MRNRVILSCLVLVWCFGSLSAGQADSRLSLDDCIRLAMEAPSQVKRAQRDVRIAQLDGVVARSGFLPHSSLEVDYFYNSPSRTHPDPFSFVASNATRELAALVTVVEDVDISGRVRAEYRRARANQDIADANLGIAERDLKRAVSGAYYRLLLARKLTQIFQDRVEEASRFEQRARLLADAGEAARADVVKAASQAASFREAVSRARTAAELANQELASFWTSDVSTRLELVEALDLPLPEPVIETRPDAYLSRQEFRLFDAQQRGFDADARQASSALLPQLQVGFQWGVDQETSRLSLDDRGYAAFARLSLNVFDWSKARSQARQAVARAAQIEDARKVAERQFSREYQSALRRVRGGYERISLARIQVTAAEEDLRLGRLRYEGGEGPALEVVTAQAQLAEARSSYYSAIADYLEARVDLEVASGR